jgi:DNA-binding NarL/FixJ family response regulator
VDDHPIVVAGLAALIDSESDLEVCGHAATALEALRAIDSVKPDLVLVDLSLGASSGLTLLGQLAQRGVATLVVTMHDDPTWAERALAAGALGFVHKSEATRDVVSAVRRVRSGRLWVSERLSEQLLRRRHGPPSREGDTSAVSTLSDRELEVFIRIGRGLTTKRIGEELHLSPKTVQTYRLRIKEKLGLSSAAELSSEATRWVVAESSSRGLDGGGTPSFGPES